MLTSVLRWIRAQFPAVSDADSIALASAMLDVYYSDPQYYGGIELWRLHDAARNNETL